MKKPLIALILGGLLIWAGYHLAWERRMMIHHAARLPITLQETGPDGRDDDFFNTPVLSELPPSDEQLAMLREADRLWIPIIALAGSGGLLALGGFLRLFLYLFVTLVIPKEMKKCDSPES